MIGITAVYIWAIILLILGIGLIFIGLLYWAKARKILQVAKKSAELVEKRTNMKFNRIATLSIHELDQYLADVYSMVLELSSVSNVSELDPKRDQNLYAYSITAMYEYLGSDTIDAIEYYYGKNFITKWCEYRYRILENRGVLLRILNREVTAEGIRPNITKRGTERE